MHGITGPAGGVTLEGWLTWLQGIKPREVQIYTLHRGYPDPALESLSREELMVIKERAVQAGISVEIY